MGEHPTTTAQVPDQRDVIAVDPDHQIDATEDSEKRTAGFSARAGKQGGENDGDGSDGDDEKKKGDGGELGNYFVGFIFLAHFIKLLDGEFEVLQLISVP